MSETLFDYGVEDTTPKTRTEYEANEDGFQIAKQVKVKPRGEFVVTGECECGLDMKSHWTTNDYGYERYECENEDYSTGGSLDAKWYVIQIGYNKEVDTSGKVLETIKVSEDSPRHTKLEDGYGNPTPQVNIPMGKGKYSLKHIESVFKAILDIKSKELLPYKEFISEEVWGNQKELKLSDTEFYRNVPFKNFGIEIDKSTINVFKRRGFDFDKWLKEYESVKEITPSKEYVKALKRGKEYVANISPVWEKIRYIRESLRYKLGKVKSDSYGEKKLKTDYFPDMKMDTLYEKLKELKKEMENCSEEMDKLRIETNSKPHDDYLDISDVKEIDNLFEGDYHWG